MKATDLRIGNLVYRCFKNEKQIIKIKSLDDFFVNGLGISAIEPIPITEDMLFMLGFDFVNNEFYRSKNYELALCWTVNKNKMIPIFDSKRLITGYDFKYIHQLQNLYYSLTNEEI